MAAARIKNPRRNPPWKGWITIRKFIENWKGFDYVLGWVSCAIFVVLIQLAWTVSPGHLWDLLRFNFVDIILSCVAIGCFRYCYMMYQSRGIPKFKTDWPVFWDRNGPMIGIFSAGVIALALIDPQLTIRIVNIFK